MNFAQSFKLALKSLKTSKMRAFLTMLGIIIGVGAVIVILSLGNGMTNMMNSQFEKMGSNLIQVMTYGRGTGGTRDVDVEDLYELVDKYPQYLTGVTPYVSASAKVRYQTDDYDRTSVYGVSEAFFKEDTKGTMQGETLAEGRFLSYIDVERHQNVCVIGDYLAQTAFRGDALGKTISLGGVPYTVIGVLSKSGDSSEGSADDVIYIPYENALELMGARYVTLYIFTSTSGETAAQAKEVIDSMLYDRFQGDTDAYFTQTMEEQANLINAMMGVAIGVLVADAAAALGMKIVGYDPFLSVTHALNLTPGVEVVDTLPELYAKADYISLHLPMNDATRGTLNEAAFAAMKDGVRIVNLARGELVDTPALKAALDSGKCAAYVTDFPNSETAAMEGVVAIPHLGASTPESEDNCAMMAAREVKEYLDNGSIINSVNLPNLTMAWAAKTRVCVISKGADAAAIAGAVPAVASASNTRGEYAYTILDTDAAVDEAAIAAIPGVLRVRVLTR